MLSSSNRNKRSQDYCRARQNVIFEHGYLTAKLGRQNVCALVKNTVEIPNDLYGIVYVTLDSSDSWKLQLAQNMKSAGYQIDFNKIIS
ncbi:TIR domain-containing protein [Latilactobacillus curvatus]|uniref:TIR domain-containing protein n=1 Tax=Latilactobacillus curvatus TaxID=28038 RepID=UPI00240E816A|nr:TIR domain-containing protein [Latilactobacillus curvatus]